MYAYTYRHNYQPNTLPQPSLIDNHTQSINRSTNRYVVLANILANSDINPFAATEAKVYQVRTSESSRYTKAMEGCMCTCIDGGRSRGRAAPTTPPP